MDAASNRGDQYQMLVELLAELVDATVSKRRYVVVRKPDIDPLRWVERQMRWEERGRMDDELTAELLGTQRYKRIA